MNLTSKYIKLDKTLECTVVSIGLRFLLPQKCKLFIGKLVDKKFRESVD